MEFQEVVLLSMEHIRENALEAYVMIGDEKKCFTMIMDDKPPVAGFELSAELDALSVVNPAAVREVGRAAWMIYRGEEVSFPIHITASSVRP